jgi:MFS family permease
MAAMNMQMFARMWLMKQLTESPLIVGATAFAHAIPMLCLSLFGGVIADRLQKKYVMLIGQAASAIIVLGVAITLSLGYLSPDVAGSWWILVVASVFQGTIMALMMPSRQAILPEIVGEEQLMNAVSLNTLGMNVLRILVPAATGFLIKPFGYAGVYYLMSGMYVVSVVFMLFLPRTSTISVGGRGALDDIKEGLRYLRGQKTIVLVLVVTLVAVLLSMSYIYMLPFIAEDILDVGTVGGGLLLTISGVGAIVASVVLASLPNKKRGLMLLVSCFILGLALAGFAFSSYFYLSLGMMVFVGLGQTGRMTLSNTLIQYYVEGAYRGRVMSVYMMEFGLTSFGTFAAGAIAESIGPQWAIGGFAMVLVVFSLLAITFLPSIRRLD